MGIKKLLLIIQCIVGVCVLSGCRSASPTSPAQDSNKDIKEENTASDIVRVPPKLKVLEDGTIVPQKGKGMSRKDFNRWIAGYGWEEVEVRNVLGNGSVGEPKPKPAGLAGFVEIEKLYFTADSVKVMVNLNSWLYHWLEPITWSSERNTLCWSRTRREVAMAEDKEDPIRFITTKYITILSYDKKRQEMVVLSRKRYQREGGIYVQESFDKLYGYKVIWYRRMTNDELKANLSRYSLSRKEYEHRKYGI